MIIIFGIFIIIAATKTTIRFPLKLGLNQCSHVTEGAGRGSQIDGRGRGLGLPWGPGGCSKMAAQSWLESLKGAKKTSMLQDGEAGVRSPEPGVWSKRRASSWNWD